MRARYVTTTPACRGPRRLRSLLREVAFFERLPPFVERLLPTLRWALAGRTFLELDGQAVLSGDQLDRAALEDWLEHLGLVSTWAELTGG